MELNDGEDTLERHKSTLLALAKKLGLSIGSIKEEIVSGDSIDERPQMQELLTEVNAGMWEGVLVMEVERLARGDTIDQGIVARSFLFSSTKIITPVKTYDPENEFDQEYFEFGLFMSRREYATTKRRMQNGRIKSVQEGKWVANRAPMGYDRTKLENDKGFTLIPNKQAPIIQMIFNWYVNDKLGMYIICNRLDEMGFKPLYGGKHFTVASIKDILSNPAYMGKVRWGWRKVEKKLVDNKLQRSRPLNSDPLLCDGLHEPLICEETYQQAQEIRARRRPRLPLSFELTNPLAGLVVCSQCHRHMTRKAKTKSTPYDIISCPYTACNTVSARFSLIESEILKWLDNYISNYELISSDDLHLELEDKQNKITILQKELATYDKKRIRIYDLLEDGIYTKDVFLERNQALEQNRTKCMDAISSLNAEILKEQLLFENTVAYIPRCKDLLANYDTLTPQEKNNALKMLIMKIEYTKLEKSKRGENNLAKLTLDVYPRISSH